MRRLFGFLLAGALMMLPAFSQGHGTALAQQAPQKTTFTGDMVLWAFSVDGTGPRPITSGSTPAKAKLTMRIFGLSLNSLTAGPPAIRLTVAPDRSDLALGIVVRSSRSLSER